MKITADDVWLLAGDARNCEIIAKCLNESEEAKQLLRDAGFGVTGQGILETTKEALST